MSSAARTSTIRTSGGLIKSKIKPTQLALLLHVAFSSLAVTATVSPVMAAETQNAVKHYNLSAQSLSKALVVFSSQAGILLSVDAKLTDGKNSQPLQGDFTVQDGLNRLLAGSGLVAYQSDNGTYLLQVGKEEKPVTLSQKDTELAPVTVVGDWLGTAKQSDVFEHPGARDVVRREQFTQQGAMTVREVLNKIPGVIAPENNGTGGQDLALNVGVRGLNPRLSSRATILMDGIPVPNAPYGQPQLSFAPISLGNMDAIDVVRDGGAVRYGPQNVGGVINFVTRAIPKDYLAKVNVETEMSTHSNNSGKTTASAIIGGTNDKGLGGALLYTGVRGSDWRDHSYTEIDDLMLKGSYAISSTQKVNAILQHYEGQADMPSGLSVADYAKDPFQSTRPYDHFWGRRNLAGMNYEWTPNANQKLYVNAFYTQTFRSSYLATSNNKTINLIPRSYWVKGLETRFSQAFYLGQVHHEIGVGYRFINEQSHEQKFGVAATLGVLPTYDSTMSGQTRSGTNSNAVYMDDRIDIGDWTITPGIRYEMIRVYQNDYLKSTRKDFSDKTPLPAINAVYHLNDHLNLFANTEESYGSLQYLLMNVAGNDTTIEPEKARTWSLGARYDDGDVQAELSAFMINFNNQYDATYDSITKRGKTRYQGLESSLSYNLGALDNQLRGLRAYMNYTFTDAKILAEGKYYGNTVPFSSKHKALLGLNYQTGAWTWDVNAQFLSHQFADNANTVAESVSGDTGLIPGYVLLGMSGQYKFGDKETSPVLGIGVKNLLDRRYFTRANASSDANIGKYVGQPRTLFVQMSAGF